MEQIVSENLFLLEFVVDKCLILPCALPKEVHDIIGETCLSFSFLDHDPQDVCEEDFCPKRRFNTTEEENMKSGKSCLFAMSSAQANAALKEFDINLAVFKKVKIVDALPENKIQIGSAVVPLAKTFNEIIEMAKKNKEEDTKNTVSKSLKECFNIVNIKDEIIGSVSVYVRISCLGKFIITQFQMNLEEKSVYFKDNEGKSLYKYRKAKKTEMGQGEGGRYKKCKSYKTTTFSEDIIPSEQEQAQVQYQEPTDDGRCEDCNPPGICPLEEPPPPCGDDKDYFIMRIGKKTDCKGKKPKLEVIMCTPKGLPKKPLPKKNEKETECYEHEFPKQKGKKGKGKGKGDKNGKEDDGKKGLKNGNGKNGKKEKESAMPSYAGMILLKERKTDDDCCRWCPPEPCQACYPCMPSEPYGMPYGSPCSCFSDTYTYICPPSNTSCERTWDTPSNITLQCSLGRIRSACCY